MTTPILTRQITMRVDLPDQPEIRKHRGVRTITLVGRVATFDYVRDAAGEWQFDTAMVTGRRAGQGDSAPERMVAFRGLDDLPRQLVALVTRRLELIRQLEALA